MPGQKRRHGINGFNTPSADNWLLIASRMAEDFDDDWLIFKSGVSKMGVHPTNSEWEGQTYDHPRHHDRAHVRGYGGESGRLLFSAQLCMM
jgi:hypothetical protein